MRLYPAIILALAPIQPALGQEPAAREKFTCDAPGGAFSRYERTIGSGPAALTATVRVNQLRNSGNWRPVVNVMLSGGDGKRVGFRFLPDGKSKKTIIFASLPDTQPGAEKAIGETDIKAQFAIELKADATGTQVSVNGRSLTGAALQNAVWTLDLSCSSIDAHIDNISVQVR